MGKQAKRVKSKYYRCIEPMSTETTTGSETAAHVAHVDFQWILRCFVCARPVGLANSETTIDHSVQQNLFVLLQNSPWHFFKKLKFNFQLKTTKFIKNRKMNWAFSVFVGCCLSAVRMPATVASVWLIAWIMWCVRCSAHQVAWVETVYLKNIEHRHKCVDAGNDV